AEPGADRLASGRSEAPAPGERFTHGSRRGGADRARSRRRCSYSRHVHCYALKGVRGPTGRLRQPGERQPRVAAAAVAIWIAARRALAAGRDRRQLGRSALSAAGSSRGRGAGAGDLRLAQGPVAALRAGASPLTDTAALRSKVTILVTRHPGGGST